MSYNPSHLEYLLEEVEKLKCCSLHAEKYYLNGEEIDPFPYPGGMGGMVLDPNPDLIIPDEKRRKNAKIELKDIYMYNPYTKVRINTGRALGYSERRIWLNELIICIVGFIKNDNPSFMRT